jgi:hypothetical protein
MKTHKLDPELKPATNRRVVAPRIVVPMAGSLNTSMELVCQQCHTAEYFVYEQIRAVPTPDTESPAWDVECWCGQYEQFYAVRTTLRPAGPLSGLQVRP